jgi:hypothetical protein
LKAAGFDIIESLDEGDHSHFAFGENTKGLATPPREAPRSSRPKIAEPKLFEGLLADRTRGVLVTPGGSLHPRAPILRH